MLTSLFLTLYSVVQSTIGELKKLLEAASGVPIAKIRLIFRGKSLDDNQTVGPQCQIEHENVVHMVEKTVPADVSGGRGGDANSASNLAASGTSPVAGGAGVPGTSGSPGPQQGPNLVIRSVQFGWDPAAGAQPGATSTSPDGAQPAPTGSPLPNMQTGGPAGPEQNFFHNIMHMATQAASTLLGGVQPGSPQPGGPAAPSNPAVPNANGAPVQGQPQAAGAVPRPFQQIRINIPTLSPIGIAQTLLNGLESELIPQLEAMITTLGRDIVEFGPDAANMIPRSYDIRPSAQPASHNPLLPVPVVASAGSSANSSTSSSPAPTDAVTTQSLWQRALKVQGRWLDVLQSVEGQNSLFLEDEGAAPANISDLPPSRLRSTSTTASGIPLLDLPLRHPLRHVTEHLAPHIGAQIAQLHQTLFPLLSHHHINHHHRPPTGPTADTSHRSGSPTSTNGPEARNGQNTASTSSSAAAPRPAAPATILVPSSSTTPVTSTPSTSSQENANRSNANDSDEDYADADAHDYDDFNDDEIMRKEMEAMGALDSAAEADVLDAAMDDFLSASAALPSTPVTVNCEPGATLTNEQLWVTWQETIDRDVETQRRSRLQAPFSDAYEGNRFTPAEQSADHSRALLEDLLEEAESTVPGATASGLPLSSAPLPPVLLDTFNTRLGRYIQGRLEADPDWQALQARGQTSRFPNLSRLDS